MKQIKRIFQERENMKRIQVNIEEKRKVIKGFEKIYYNVIETYRIIEKGEIKEVKENIYSIGSYSKAIAVKEFLIAMDISVYPIIKERV